MNPAKVAREAIEVHGALQKPGELAGLLALLLDLAPRVVVEVGSDAGGTLWAWRQLPSVEHVAAVSLPNAGYDSGRPLNRHGALVVEGDSHDPDTADTLAAVLLEWGQLADFLLIDGDHTYDGVKADYEMYAPLVRGGGIVALHDICPHPAHPDVQVDRFWAELVGDKEWIVTDPATWGGIGLVRVGAAPDKGYVAYPSLGAPTELVSR